MNNYAKLTAPDTLRIERLLPGPIERIWSYLTDSNKRGTWLAAGEMELQAGGKVEHIFRNSTLTDNDDPAPPKYAQHCGEQCLLGQITALEPLRLLSYVWNQGSAGESEVRFELIPQGDQVLLILTHSRLTARSEMLSVAAGWHTHLDILADRLNGETPAGFWRTHTRLETEYDQQIPLN